MSACKAITLLYFLIFDFLFYVQGQTDVILDTKTTLDVGSYTLPDLLDRISEIPDIGITYNGNEIPLSSIVVVNENSPTLRQTLNLIISQLPVQYQVRSTYIILKAKHNEAKYQLTGLIKDDDTGEPLIGASIYLPKDFIGDISDNNGYFTLKLPPGSYSLVISSMGYVRKKIDLKIDSDREIEVRMNPAKVMIDEVSIVSQRNFFGNLDLGRSIAAIDAEEIANLNVNNVADILHAREPGVWTTRISGAPGDHQRVRIRGIHSIYSGVDPLYVVDGIPIPNVNLSSLGVNDVNIHDIQRVTILKDVSSSSIFGFQGGNGVVLIDTKKGGENSIGFTSRFGIQRFDHFYRLMNTSDFLATIDTFSSFFDSEIGDRYPAFSDTLANTNWQEVFFRPAMVQEYVLNMTGALKKINYYVSGSYFNQEGVLIDSDYKKYTCLMNFGRTFFKRFTVGINYHAALQKNRNNLDTYMGNTQILKAIIQAPCALSVPDRMVYSEGGAGLQRIYYPYRAFYGKINADSLFIDNEKSLDVLSHAVSASLNVHLADNLYLDAFTSLSYRKLNYLSKSAFYWNGDYNGLLSNYEKYFFSTQKILLSYAKTFSKHEINLAAGIRNYRDRALWEVDSTDPRYTSESGIDELYIRNSLARYGDAGDISRKITSVVGHLNYTYNKKYTISLASDYDQLKEGRFVRATILFPSVAFNWDISREPVIDRMKWIDRCNLYVNWGKAGNYPLSTLAGYLYEDIPNIFGDGASGAPGTISLVTNYHLKQEEMKEVNYGFRFSALNKRIEIDAGFFIRTDQNLIVQNELPIFAGGGITYLNIAQMKGSGVEYGLEVIPILRSKITWLSRFGYSQFHQVVKRFNTDKELVLPNNDVLIPTFYLKEGEELGNIYGYKYVGRWTEEDEALHSQDFFNELGLKYKNIDPSSPGGTTTNRTIIGNSIPDYTWSWYNSFTTKRFTFDFLWYAVMGFSKYNATRASTYMAGVNPELKEFVFDSIQAFANQFVYASSYFVEDASFIRLKYITITYNPSVKLWNKVNYSVSLSFENMITLTKYSGYDPEATIYTGNSFTDNSVDRGAYPTPRSVYVSIDLKF